ncbi:MAG: LptF/LptG family permease [Hyphomicrobiales bacterium]
MRISSIYVLQQIFKPLGGAMIIGLLVLLADRLVRLLDVTLGKKNSLMVVFEMLAYLVPHYMGLAMPAALFLGLLFGFSSLSKNSEIDAFMSTGIGLHQLVRPVFIMAIIFALAAIAIFGWVQPYGRYAYRAIFHAVKSVQIFYLAEEGVFMQAGNRTFVLENLNRDTNEFERIFLYQDKGASGSLVITSRDGSLVELEGDHRPVLRLLTGHRLRVEQPITFGADAPLPKAVVGDFVKVDTPLGKEEEDIFRKRGNEEKELTFVELFQKRNKPPPGRRTRNLDAELHKRLVAIATILILPFLAVPFALGRRRGQRAYRFAVAVIILVAFNEIVEQGKIAVHVGKSGPFLAMWVPFILLAIFALWRFYRTAFTLRPDRLDPLFDRLADFNVWVKSLVKRKKSKPA